MKINTQYLFRGRRIAVKADAIRRLAKRGKHELHPMPLLRIRKTEKEIHARMKGISSSQSWLFSAIYASIRPDARLDVIEL